MIKGKCPYCKKGISVKLPSYRKPIGAHDQAMLGSLAIELKDLNDVLVKIAESTSLMSGTRNKVTQLLKVIEKVKDRA